MTQEEAVEAVFARWRDLWDPSIPYTFEGEQFTPPAGRWARVSVRHGESNQVTLGPAGSRKFDRNLTVMVQFFDDVNVGRKSLDLMGVAGRVIFEGVSFSGLHFPGRAPVRELGPDGFGRNQHLLEAEGFYEEVR